MQRSRLGCTDDEDINVSGGVSGSACESCGPGAEDDDCLRLRKPDEGLAENQRRTECGKDERAHRVMEWVLGVCSDQPRRPDFAAAEESGEFGALDLAQHRGGAAPDVGAEFGDRELSISVEEEAGQKSPLSIGAEDRIERGRKYFHKLAISLRLLKVIPPPVAFRPSGRRRIDGFVIS